jgi:hypothetical protein
MISSGELTDQARRLKQYLNVEKWQTGDSRIQYHYYKEFTLIIFIKINYRERIVGIATGYGLDDRGVGVRVPAESRIFSTSSRPALGST